MGARRGLRSLAPSTRATWVCEKAAQQSTSLLRALLSAVGGRCSHVGLTAPCALASGRGLSGGGGRGLPGKENCPPEG